MDEQRIIELETKLAYQEHTLNELNDVVSNQQQQIGKLEQLLTTLGSRLEALADAVPSGAPAAAEKPPHY